MATKKITLNELRSLVKQIIKESDLGSVYSAYAQGNEQEYPSKIENIINQVQDDGLFSSLFELNEKKGEATSIISSLLEPTFLAFIGLATKLKSSGMLKSKSEAEEFITTILANQFSSILSDGNKKEVIRRFTNKF